jgi:hypothetical protein
LNAADDEELLALRRAPIDAAGRPTPIIDRCSFHSVSGRLPTGVLFELATRDIASPATSNSTRSARR